MRHAPRTMLLFCVLAMATTCSALAQGTWEAIPGAPVAGRLDDMHFVDPSTGWVVDSSGEIYRTTDAGASWHLQASTGLYFRTIYFADSQVGIAGTLGSQLLYRTTDAGGHWVAIPNNSIPVPRPPAVCGLAGFGDAVYGTGAYFGPAVLIRSTDRGATWGSVDMSPYARNLVDCYFTSETSGFAIGGSPGSISQSKPVILRTTDGGTTWSTRYLGTQAGAYCWKIYFVDALTGYASVYSTSSATVLRTKDGGLSWSAVNVPGIDELEGIGFVTETHGWVDGWGGSAESTDGGVTWQPYQIQGAASAINRYQFFGASSGFAVGYTVFRYQATTDAPPLPTAPRETVFLLSASPNPSRGSIRFSFTLPVGERAMLRLYDSLGRELRTIASEELPAGPHTVDWDARGGDGARLPAGIYLYRLDAGGRAESRTVTLLQP
ncbi:MAG: YCF48-related protein [Candidatus Eisenbacteria bacterium]